jgi:hypothetical protein
MQKYEQRMGLFDSRKNGQFENVNVQIGIAESLAPGLIVHRQLKGPKICTFTN